VGQFEWPSGIVTPLQPTGPDQLRRYAAAELRKQMRREMEQRFALTRKPVSDLI
jgi:hypothetical protein